MSIVFILILATAVIFLWWSAGSLPAAVAAHFMPNGNANGFVPRQEYFYFMLALVVLVPGLLYLLGRLAGRLPQAHVDARCKAYWLTPYWFTPQSKARALAALGRFSIWVSYATLGLLCGTHWFVVQANLEHPAHLAQTPLIGLASIYFLALIVGIVVVASHFFRNH